MFYQNPGYFGEFVTITYFHYSKRKINWDNYNLYNLWKLRLYLNYTFVLLRNIDVILRDNQNSNNVKKQYLNLDKNVKIL